jgi:rubrerythrin
MENKPSYLGLLNAIALAESEAECYLSAWAEVTPHDDVRQVLRTVALREGEHGKAFAKRICELGFDVVPKDNDDLGWRMDVAASREFSDAEKFAKLKVGQQPVDGDDVFAGMFRNPDIDIQTGALLGRYIAEERDSGRMLRSCCETVTAREAGSGNGSGRDADLAALNARLERIEKLLEKVGSKK